MGFRALLAHAVLVLALSCAGRVRADMAADAPDTDSAPTSPEDAEYKGALDRAIGEFNAGHFFEARILFLKAHALRPSARTFRALGMVEYELRHYAACVYDLRQALVDTRKPLTAEQQAEVARTLALAEPLIGEYTLSGASGALVVDGKPATLTDRGELLFDPGAHRIESGGRALEVEVQGGERDTLHFENAPEIAGQSENPGPDEVLAAVEAPGASAPQAPFPWPQAVLAGSGVLLIAAGGVVGLVALDAQHDFDAACPSSRKVCDRDAEHKRNRADDLAVASDVLWISGAAAAASGVIWWLATRKQGSESATQASVAVGPRAAGVLVRGAF